MAPHAHGFAGVGRRGEQRGVPLAQAGIVGRNRSPQTAGSRQRQPDTGSAWADEIGLMENG